VRIQQKGNTTPSFGKSIQKNTEKKVAVSATKKRFRTKGEETIEETVSLKGWG